MTYFDPELRDVGPRRKAPTVRSSSWWTWPRTLVVATLIGAAAVGVCCLVMLIQTGVLWPEAIPPYVQFRGYDYSCQDRPSPLWAGLTVQGFTIGGGAIYALPPVPDQGAPNWVVVASGSTSVTCIDGMPEFDFGY